MLTAKVVASGTTITMDYDNDARPSHVYQASYPTPTTTYTYSQSTGRLTSIVDPAGTTAYDYNANGQLFHLTDPFNSSSQVTYLYDSAGRMSSRTDPAGLTWTKTYESGTGRLDTQTIRKAGTTLGSFNLGYDQASNVTSREERVLTETGGNNADSGTWTYGYDAANRMISSTAASGTVTTYGYDGASNRTSVKVGNKQPTTTSYDAAGLPTTSSDNTTFTHDAIGELTKIDRSPGTSNDWNYAYNAWGVVTSGAHVAGTPDVSYTTDALDRVLSRTASATTTTYTYRGKGEDAAKAQVGAATPVFYAFSPGGPLARRTGTDAATLRYFVNDLHGDVVGLAATTGTNPMKGSILYSPWGVPGTKTGELATFPAQGHLGFQGQLTDALTGQVDILTRYYEPTLGRFTKRDVLFGEPTDPVTLNLYAYGVDSPLTNTDQTGLCPNPSVCPPPPTFSRQEAKEWNEIGRQAREASLPIWEVATTRRYLSVPSEPEDASFLRGAVGALSQLRDVIGGIKPITGYLTTNTVAQVEAKGSRGYFVQAWTEANYQYLNLRQEWHVTYAGWIVTTSKGKQFYFTGAVGIPPGERQMAVEWPPRTADYSYGSFVVPRGYGRPVAITGVVKADQLILGSLYARDTVFFPEPQEYLVPG